MARCFYFLAQLSLRRSFSIDDSPQVGSVFFKHCLKSDERGGVVSSSRCFSSGDTTVLRALSRALPADQCSRADRPALAANETISMKPSAATRPRLAARLLISEKIGSSSGLALNVALERPAPTDVRA